MKNNNSKTKVTVILKIAHIIITMTMSIIIDRSDAKVLVGDTRHKMMKLISSTLPFVPHCILNPE